MKKIYIILSLTLLIATSCEEFLEQEPVDVITTDQVIIDGASAETAILGVYSRIQTGGIYGNTLIADPGVLSDELTHSGSFPSISEMDANNVSANNTTTDNMFGQGYTTIFQANNILEILESETEFTGLTADARQVIIGEARFLRALLHFHLTNYYGDVPLALTTDLDALSTISRTSQADVYQFVIDEAQIAATELSIADFGTDEQFRASSWAARALEARTRLYSGDVSGAGTVANDIIENGPFELEANYADLYGAGPVRSDEIIMGIFYSNLDQNGLEFQFLPDGRFEYAVSPQLLEAYAVDADPRALVGVNAGDALGRSFVNKYTDLTNRTDGVIVFRLAEMYLIRAEANLGTAQALTDINTIRERAGVPLAPSANLNVILNERFIELAFEGHRWFDLIRTGNAVSVMSQINSDFTANDALMPIPQREIEQNSALTQNPGY